MIVEAASSIYQNLMEKEKSIKNGTKKILYTGREI